VGVLVIAAVDAVKVKGDEGKEAPGKRRAGVILYDPYKNSDHAQQWAPTGG